MSTTTTPTAELVRAKTFDDYIGQDKLKRDLRITIESAVQRRAVLDHILLAGPSGYGKTTLAKIIAADIGDPILDLKMPMGEKEFCYAATELGQGVVFLDEAHNAPRSFQEVLLHALESGSIVSKTGVRYPVEHITFILGTTEPAKLIPPLVNRCLTRPRFVDYSDDEMALIVEGMAARAGVELPPYSTTGPAQAGRGNPRMASSFIIKARDLAITGNELTLERILEFAGVDDEGLTDSHRYYLETLRELGDESGLVNITSLTQMSKPEVEDLERLLIRRGFVKLTSKGRTLTTIGVQKVLGRRPPTSTREIA